MAWRRFGHDVLLIENGTAALAEACGVQVEYRSDSAPVAKEPAIRSLDEVDDLEVPDPSRDPILSELLKATRIVVEEIGGQAFVIGQLDLGKLQEAVARWGKPRIHRAYRCLREIVREEES